MTNEVDVQNLIEKTIEHYNKIDILVNNAGVLELGTIENSSLDQVKVYLLLLTPLLHVQFTVKTFPFWK